MATPEKTVNVRVLTGGPLHIEIEIPGADKAQATRKMVIIPGAKDPAGVRGVDIPESEWKLAAQRPMTKAMLEARDLAAV